MLDYDQRKKLRGEWEDNVTPQQKADFNKKMRRKLKLWLSEIPDMIRILNGLPPKVIENASLLDDLFKVVEFMDTVLEKTDPLPVAEHESGEKRTFRTDAFQRDDMDEWGSGWKSSIKILNDKKYLIRTHIVTASHIEIEICDALRKHAESIQRYIDPAIVVVGDPGMRKELNEKKVMADLFLRRDMMGACSMDDRIIKGEIPTVPPCKPRAMVDGKICDFEIDE